MFIENCEDSKYRSLDFMNFSMISDFDKLDIIEFHKKWILKEKEESTESYFKFGSLVDNLLTNFDNFWNIYEIIDNIPSDKLLQIADYVVSRNKTAFSVNQDELFLEARKINEYYLNYKDDTILKKFKEDAGLLNYIEKKSKSNKTFISTDMYNKAVEKYMAIKHHSLFAKYFEPSDTLKVIFQPVITYKHPVLNTELKCKLDMVVIDSFNKVIEVIDIKTTSTPIFNFKESIEKYRYDFQSIIYTDAVKSEFLSKEEFKDYTITFSFLVINSIEHTPRPIRYYIPDKYINAVNRYSDKKRSLFDIVSDIRYHINSNQWIYKRGFESSEVVIDNLFEYESKCKCG